ncbi:hypothetical protein [Bacillus subtilis]|uniref:hypothetical protein n=1 Tax=Bacillus subtilis TaxID=1423 RepID=UPI001B9CA6D6|nr:hypothetical protein [Bacillus subtilis]CAI6330486.1 hypothetical protein NRS6096_21780 [Bacillus subtilis]
MKIITKITKKMFMLKTMFLKKRNDFIDKELDLFKEKFMLNNKRYPNDTEEKHFKRNLVARMGILAYFLISIIVFISITVIKGI